jgi:hypothetical protein
MSPGSIFSTGKNLSIGNTGKDVTDVQLSLNNRRPMLLPFLATDGIFGAKTDARVREFQRNNGLKIDGIVGPITRAALAGGDPTPSWLGCDCCNPEIIPFGHSRQYAEFFRNNRIRKSSSVGHAGSPGPLRFLNDTEKNVARTVYGNSLDFSTIYISKQKGLGGRSFTMAFPGDNETVQIMNLGTDTPGRNLLIHELAHVWQSQHHSNKYRFMANAVDSMKEAMKASVLAVPNDPMVSLNHNFPAFYPYDAYAYNPSATFASLAAEQMANAIEHGEPGIVGHVRGVTLNTVDPACVSALSKAGYGDRRVPGVK